MEFSDIEAQYWHAILLPSHADTGCKKMYDTYKRREGDSPTIGIILCAETNADVARFSTLATNKQMYAAKYLTYMPSKEELRREIERQKEIFMLQQNNPCDTAE